MFPFVVKKLCCLIIEPSISRLENLINHLNNYSLEHLTKFSVSQEEKNLLKEDNERTKT